MKRIINWLIPKETKFYDLLSKQSDNVLSGVSVFNKMLTRYETLSSEEKHKMVKRVKDFELNGDKIIHEIIEELHTTFLTPFDGEDIHYVAELLDDVIDLTNGTAKRLVMYNITSITPEMNELNSIIIDCVKELDLSIKGLRKLDNMEKHLIRINTLENEADVVNTKGIADLFEGEKNPVRIIKYKEILEMMDNIIDKCEDIANTLNSLVVKHA